MIIGKSPVRQPEYSLLWLPDQHERAMETESENNILTQYNIVLIKTHVA